MNIIFDGVILRQAKATEPQYSLDDIVFFIDKKYFDLKYYVILKDERGRFDAVELKQTNSTNSNYYNMVCTMNHPIKIASGECKLSLLAVDKDTAEVKVSTSPITVKLENESYNFKAQIAVIEQFSYTSAEIYKNMAALYDKLTDLSNLNIEMLKEKEAVL